MSDRVSEECTWRGRYERLVILLQDIADDSRFDEETIEDFPISASEEFFISNDLQVVDNEEYAKSHWGPGKYRKFILAPDQGGDEC